ncbi:hypothetical protein IMG5_083970 [Ichthyophthirius multifiliis]|uniref:Uncharacterized protein n=1 Tax=Ichthyophthirius multifiliis TaxID=5932 RepID=G0QQU3_ICHMU|nr:hypothetical protein IMG5_083970 [Ichthyophthirius multifiliis]EGR32412.1 hypothetical protein IMG5_083970 [Ichthyophthirius multifiliis]|eukprot:XP_004036398.1 hypothetical protein IMG5_083970 [Ichthyophthirius multifiliis]
MQMSIFITNNFMILFANLNLKLSIPQLKAYNINLFLQNLILYIHQSKVIDLYINLQKDKYIYHFIKQNLSIYKQWHNQFITNILKYSVNNIFPIFLHISSIYYYYLYYNIINHYPKVNLFIQQNHVLCINLYKDKNISNHMGLDIYIYYYFLNLLKNLNIYIIDYKNFLKDIDHDFLNCIFKNFRFLLNSLILYKHHCNNLIISILKFPEFYIIQPLKIHIFYIIRYIYQSQDNLQSKVLCIYLNLRKILDILKKNTQFFEMSTLLLIIGSPRDQNKLKNYLMLVYNLLQCTDY